jgi:hypothetical protein
LPSPYQTNWRIHVVDPHSGHRGIYFVTNAITATVPALGARLLSEGMPMHVLRAASIERSAEGALRLELDPGDGSAPDASLQLAPAPTPELIGPWRECWPDYRAFLEYCVPQDRAMSSQPLKNRISRQEINLGIPVEACEPLQGQVRSQAAAALAGDAQPLCFRVARGNFRFTGEVHDRAK